jgi:hypothetical protein
MLKLMQKLSLKFEKNLFLWVVLISVFIPIYPKFPLFNIPGTYVAVRLEDFLIAFVVFGWLLGIFYKWRLLLAEHITKAILLFWVIGLLSLFSGIFLTQTVVPHLGFLHYLRRVETMILFLVAFSAFSSIKQIKVWLMAMFFASLFVVLYGFGQQFLQFPVISTTNREFSKGLILFLSPEARVNSTFAGHYDLAAFLAFFLVVLTGYFFYVKGLFRKGIMIVTGLLSFILLALTAARVSFLAALLGIISVLFLTGRKKLILAVFVLAFAALIISPDLRHRTIATLTVNLLGGGGAKYEPPPQMPGNTTKFSIENAATGAATPSGVPVDIVPGEPLDTTELGVSRSFEIRLNEEWPRAIRAFEKNPFLGTGYSSIGIASDNDYLRSLGEVGILGTLSLALIFFIIIKRMWETIRNSQGSSSRILIIGMFGGLLTIFLTQTFIDVLESSKIAQLLWLSLGVGFASMEIGKDDN